MRLIIWILAGVIKMTMYKSIIYVSLSLILNACVSNVTVNEKLMSKLYTELMKPSKELIQYYGGFNEVYMQSRYEEKHTFRKNIPRDKLKKAIDNLQYDPFNGIFKVYYKNVLMYKKGIPIKVEKYTLFGGLNQVREYDKIGRISTFKTLYEKENYTQSYQYTNSEKIITTIRDTITQHRPHCRKNTDHYFYNEKHHLVKIFKYCEGKLYSISRPDKKHKNLINEYDLDNKRIDTWNIDMRKGE